MSQNRILSLLEIVLATLFFSTSGIWTKISGQDAFVLALFRALIPILYLSILHFSKKREQPLIGKWNCSLAVASILNALRSLLLFQALIMTDISKAIVMLYTWPVFTLIIQIILKRERLSPVKFFLLLTALSGIVVIYMDNLLQETLNIRDIAGMSVMMASAFVYSITIVIFKEQGKQRNHYEITFYQNFAAVPIFLIIVIIKLLFADSLISSSLSFAGVGFASINGLLVGVFGFLLYFKGLNKLQASVASQLAYLEIIFAMLWGIILYQERPGVPFLIGAVLIVIGALGRSFLKDKD